MANPSVLSGTLSEAGAIPVLREVEEHRTTGVLWFRHGPTQGEIALLRGQLCSEQPTMSDGRDPVEVFLELRQGEYQVLQRLPELPISSGTEARRSGTLEAHAPADLMNYCESVGLTGLLVLGRDDHRAEVVYDRGDLVAIRLNGEDEADLRDVFGWTDGTFYVDAQTAAPDVEEVTDPGVVEVALADIIQERESARPSGRTSDTQNLQLRSSEHDALPATTPSIRPNIDTDVDARLKTVKVVYLGARSTDVVSAGVRHVQRTRTTEEALPVARANRVRAPLPPAPPAPPSADTVAEGQKLQPETSVGIQASTKKRRTSVTVLLLVIVAVLLAFAVLALMPPLE